MALVVKDRVKETTTTTGTGTINLAGAASGFQSFVSGVGDGNTTYYAITDANGAWEVGLGTVTDGSPDTLARTTVLATSNGDTSAITLSSGTHTVFSTYPAGKAVYLDASGNLSYTVDISSDTNLAGGTGITLTGDTLSTTDSEIVHDNLSGFVANEHIDWTTDQGSTNIHSGNYDSGASVLNDLTDVTIVETNNLFIETDGAAPVNAITSGESNIAIGNNSLSVNTTGHYNIGIGENTLKAQDTGASRSIAIGKDAMQYAKANQCVAIGYEALEGDSSSNSWSQYNTAIGYQTLQDITTGDYNVSLGISAGTDITSASRCIFIGAYAGYTHTTGDSILYIGSNTEANDGTIIKADMAEKHLAIGMADDLFSNSAGDATLQIYPKDAADEAIYAKMPTSHSGSLIQMADSSGTDLFVVSSAGTVTTGTWQGTAIAQAYIANDAINGDKIADDAVDSEHYAAGSIDEEHLNATNTPTDNYLLSYDDASGGFTWVSAGGGGEANQNAFSTISVADQDDVAADSTTDTLTLAAGSNVTITTTAASDTVTIAATDTNTQLSTEEVQDIAGPLVATGGTKTLITVTYDDTNGDMDFVVDNDLSNYDNSSSGFLTAHPSISAASSSDNSGRTYIQDITLDSNGHVTGIATATETVTDTNTQLSQEQVEDFAGALVATGGTKTLITVTYDDANGNMDFVVDNDLSNYDNSSSGFITATLTNEEVMDIAGPLVATGGTKTLITVTYDDANNNMDFVVDNDLSNYDNSSSGFLTAHPTISAASSSDNSGRTYIQDITLDSNGHVTGIATATETVTDTNTQLSDEQVQDIAGGMFTGNTETLITATYQDADGTIDLVVDDDLSNYDNSSSGFLTAHPSISAASSSDNSGRTYIQDITLDSNGHVTGIATATETVTDTNTQLSTEEVQDIAGPLVATGGTKTLITVTYDDANGNMDFVVDNDLSNYDNSSSGFLTAHPNISAASSSDNSGRTYIQDITVDSNGHVTGIATATETVTDTNTQLSEEQVEDFVGGMVTGNTETGISVTYQDADGTLDFAVSDTTVAGDSGSTGITPGDTLTIAGGTNATTAMSGDTLTVNVDDAFLKNNADDTTSGTVTMANLIVGDAGNIGSASDTDAIAIASDGEVTLSQRTTFSKAVKTPLKSNTDGATITFDLDEASTHTVTLGDNRTLAISNEDAGQKFIINLVQDGTGSRTVTWFSTIKWAGGSAPTLTTTADKADSFGFLCTGTDAYYGFVIGQNI
jgi:hypothetical protein